MLAERIIGKKPKKEGTTIRVLRNTLSPSEVEVALAIPEADMPLTTFPFEDISRNSDLSEDELRESLEELAYRGVLFTRKSEEGREYGLIKPGYGFTQAWHWDGRKTPFQKKIAEILWDRQFVEGGMHKSGETETYRVVPVNKSIDMRETVYPYELIERIIFEAETLAVANCPCRVKYELVMEEPCGHPQEVCVKFDDLAEHLIDVGLAREISEGEALDIIRECEEKGLVHFADNAQDGVMHCCNCCGCACFNIGTIKRRLAGKDEMIATYFIRRTNEEDCVACGKCVDICPVDAVEIGENTSVVDEEWCIGCGVCRNVCPTDAVRLVRREHEKPPKNFEELHNKANDRRRE